MFFDKTFCSKVDSSLKSFKHMLLYIDALPICISPPQQISTYFFMTNLHLISLFGDVMILV